MTLELLQDLARRKLIRAVDFHFARQLAHYAQHSPGQIATAAALASSELGRGNVCVDLTAIDGLPLAGIRGEDIPLVDAAALRESLLGEPGVCALAGAKYARPLVLDGERLYLHRYWLSECRVAARLRALAAEWYPLGDASCALLDRLFAEDSPGAVGQKRACTMALSRGLGVITGGPGTGKTTTVARLLLVLAMQAHTQGKHCSMRLAAPTGKAAARVSEALGRELLRLRAAGLVEESVAALLPQSAQTVHRLLGAGADGRFRFDHDSPLAAELVVLDESSMVDLRLLDALLDAMPRGARLVLLGDRDQLAAVEAGNVFGALCAGADSANHADTIGVLTHSYRFDAGSGIGRLATAVNNGDSQAVAELLAVDSGAVRCMRYAEHLDASHTASIAERFRPLIAAARNGAPPEVLFELLESFRVLCAVREGEFGVTGLNRAIERALIEAGLIESGEPFYTGRPILVTRNDYGLRLYNGDVGVVVRDAGGTASVLFQQAGDAPRRLPVARLPAHETAFAMTVHKSQGSEFDEVLLVLPPTRDGAQVPGGREMLYTAITRARRGLALLLPEGALDARWLRKSEFRSGLGERLRSS